MKYGVHMYLIHYLLDNKYNVDIFEFKIMDKKILCIGYMSEFYLISMDNNYKMKPLNIENLINNGLNTYEHHISLINDNIFIFDCDFNLFIFNFEYDIEEEKEKFIITNFHKISKFEYCNYLENSCMINNKLYTPINNTIIIYNIYTHNTERIILNNYSKTKLSPISLINLQNKNIMIIYDYDNENHKFEHQIISIMDKDIIINCKSNDIFFYFI